MPRFSGLQCVHLGGGGPRFQDTKPHYMLSTGGYVMKYPDEGFTVAKLLQSPGDGNDDPFRGSISNVLYCLPPQPLTAERVGRRAEKKCTSEVQSRRV